MQIDWWTLALQAVNFLVLVWLLWRFLFRPVKRVIEERKKLADEAFEKAAKKESEAETARARYEEREAALADERQEMLKRLHQERVRGALRIILTSTRSWKTNAPRSSRMRSRTPPGCARKQVPPYTRSAKPRSRPCARRSSISPPTWPRNC